MKGKSMSSVIPDEVPPYLKKTTRSGKVRWTLSVDLARRRDELLSYAEIENKETQKAVVALLMAEHRARKAGTETEGEYEQWPVEPDEGRLAFAGFLIPLASRLAPLRLPENRMEHRLAQIKSDALKWVESVIEKGFCEFVQATPESRQAADVINEGLLLCRELGRVPTKGDFKNSTRLTWGNTKWKELFKLAGLSDLHEAGKERY